MSYNFSNAAMQFNGAITADGQIRAKSANLSGSTLSLGMASITEGELEVLDVNGGSALAGSAQANKALVVDGSRDIANINALSALGLASLDGGINVDDKFTVSAAGAVVAVGVNAGGAITGATSIDASGDLTVATITMDEFTVDGSGNTDVDGTLNVEGVPTFQAAAVFSSGISAAGSIAGATTIDGSGDLTMGTITMSGFTVDADGDTALKSLAVDDGSTIGPDSVTDLITLAATGHITIKDGAYNFDIASHDATNGLKLGGALVTATAAELNRVKVGSVGFAEGGKAAIFDDNKDLTGYRNLIGDSNSSRVMISGSNGAIDLRQKSDCPRLDIMLADNLKIRLSGSGDAQFTGEVECGSVKIDDGSTIGPDSIKDLITLAGAGHVTIKDGAYNFDIASHDASNGLKLGGTLVTSLAAELNELSGYADAAMTKDHSLVFDDGSSLKSESFADFSALLAGAGLAVNSTTKKLEVTSNAMATFSSAHTAAEGYNVYTGQTDVTVTMPAAAEAGDLIIIKATTLNAGQKITINKSVSHNKQMDGADTLKLELSFAAVNLAYVSDAVGWAIV